MRKPLGVGLLFVMVSMGEEWPQFRGPRGDGTSDARIGLPLRVVWTTELPGPGHSSPIVWDNRVFLTAFEADRTMLGAVLGRRGTLSVLALDRHSGAQLWQTPVAVEEIEKTTSVNQPASPTPATDGRRVYAFFGSIGLLAFDAASGRQVWEQRIGPTPHHMGSASSPLLGADGRLYLNAESDGPSHLYAIEKETGRLVWRVPRRTPQAGYATPVWFDGRIAVAGSGGISAYAAGTGQLSWTAAGLSDYVVPTPVSDGRRLYATSSGPGGNIVMAVNPDGTVAWRSGKGAAYVASPTLRQGHLYTVNRNCTAACLAAGSGSLVWSERLPARGECYASPVVAGDLLLIAATSGELFALHAGPAFAIRAKLELTEGILASPAITGGRVFVRSRTHLYALGQ